MPESPVLATVSRPAVILIHGAWAGAWVWDSFTPYLTRAGFDVFAVDLPGNGADATPPADVSLDLYVAHVLDLMRRIGRPVSLVAHSGGGNIAAQVAEAAPDQVLRLVYVAGIMLGDGASFVDVVASVIPDHPEAKGIDGLLDWSPDRLTSSVPADVAVHIFFGDCEPEAARAAAARLTPQPEGGRAVRPRLSPGRFGRVPRLYVEASLDRSVVPAVQKRMQALLPGAAVVTLPTAHAPQFSSPDLLAEAIIPFLRQSS